METPGVLHTQSIVLAEMGGPLGQCVSACFQCGQASAALADVCLGRDDLASLVQCVRLNLACAGICGATGRILARPGEPDLRILRASLDACALACRICAAECERQIGRVEACRGVAESCRDCEDACLALLTDLELVPM
jgi:hypothetical protein